MRCKGAKSVGAFWRGGESCRIRRHTHRTRRDPVKLPPPLRLQFAKLDWIWNRIIPRKLVPVPLEMFPHSSSKYGFITRALSRCSEQFNSFTAQCTHSRCLCAQRFAWWDGFQQLPQFEDISTSARLTIPLYFPRFPLSHWVFGLGIPTEKKLGH